MTWSGRTSSDTSLDNFIKIDMIDLKTKLDNVLAQGVTEVKVVINRLGISKNELFALIQKEGGYSTAGILSDHGTITKNEYDEK